MQVLHQTLVVVSCCKWMQRKDPEITNNETIHILTFRAHFKISALLFPSSGNHRMIHKKGGRIRTQSILPRPLAPSLVVIVFKLNPKSSFPLFYPGITGILKIVAWHLSVPLGQPITFLYNQFLNNLFLLRKIRLASALALFPSLANWIPASSSISIIWHFLVLFF